MRNILLDNEIVVKWTYQARKHYEDLGYVYTKNMQEFTVKIEHLSLGSNIKVHAKCDVCGKETVIKYQDYVKDISNHGYYACSSKCGWTKNRITNVDRYGVEQVMQCKEIRDKSKNTCLIKYGVDSISKSELFKAKYKETMNKKYNVDNYFQKDGFTEALIQYNLRKYGVEWHMQTEEYKDKYLRGKKSHAYIDGRTYLYNHDDRKYDIDGRRWRRRVFKRDNYTCQCCGDNKGHNLNAHHINGFKYYPNKRYDDENGITLCNICHKNCHKIIGVGLSNNAINFEKWLIERQETIGDECNRVG